VATDGLQAMDALQDFRSLEEKISSALVSTTRIVGQLSSRDLSFHRSLDPAVSASLDKQNTRLLNLAECLLKTAASGSGVEAPDVGEVGELDDNWRGIVEVVDSLLERADTCLDEYTGAVKKSSQAEEEVRSLASVLVRVSLKFLDCHIQATTTQAWVK
jgi:exosome complex exonuclease RRP6